MDIWQSGMLAPCHVCVEPLGPVVQLNELLGSTTCITCPFVRHLDVTFLVELCLFESENWCLRARAVGPDLHLHFPSMPMAFHVHDSTQHMERELLPKWLWNGSSQLWLFLFVCVCLRVSAFVFVGLCVSRCVSVCPCLSLPVFVACACLCVFLFVPVCLCLSLCVSVCPCLYLFVLDCPCVPLCVSLCVWPFK